MTKRLRRIAVPLGAAALALACDGEPAHVAALAQEVVAATRDAVADASALATNDAAGDGAVSADEPEIAGAQPVGGYWRYVEANGSVRFVASLGEVPASARASAQHVAGAGGGADGARTTTAPRRAAPSRPAARPQRRLPPDPAPDPEPVARRDDVEVVVYTTPWCGWCRKTLAWLDARGVDYENRDIESNAAWAAELRRKTGGTSIPVVDVGGRIVRGFNPDRLAELL